MLCAVRSAEMVCPLRVQKLFLLIFPGPDPEAIQ